MTEDVITLQNYLRKIEDEAKVELRDRVSSTAYKFSESSLTQIILFNKKREEASRLTLETYLKAETSPVICPSHSRAAVVRP